MGHVGDKLAFHNVGGLSLFLGLNELGFVLVPFSNIPIGADHFYRPVILIINQQGIGFNVVDGAVRPNHPKFGAEILISG